MANQNLVKGSGGEALITSLPSVRWTQVSGGNQQAQRGNPIFDPRRDALVTLPDEPTYEDLTLLTAYTTQTALTVSRWLQQWQESTNIALISTIADLRYTFAGCSVGGSSLFPGFDKNTQGGGAKTLTLILSVGSQALADVA